jgi:hypothetical protein
MKRHPEADLAVKIAWILCPLGFTLTAFYLRTVWHPNTERDLQFSDIQLGAQAGLIGLVLGVIVAGIVSIVYPKVDERELTAIEHHEVEEESLGAF